MTDSMQKILDEVRAVEKKEREADALYSTLVLKNWGDRIEKMMKEPVAWKEALTGRLVSDLQKKISSISYDTYTVPLFLAPPDQTKRIEKLERELADVRKNATKFAVDLLDAIIYECEANEGMCIELKPTLEQIYLALSQQER